IIGTLPVVIPVFANLLYSQRDGKLALLNLEQNLGVRVVGQDSALNAIAQRLETPHYHRRYGVSLLSSAWGQVGPP
ncbi:hypothetical protein QU614_25855, partial [Enterobacter hormaechei subsp. xiangfangensis]|nr:hypothetical protein [Enterobacter hormaechei subsp. xiangfangensis]